MFSSWISSWKTDEDDGVAQLFRLQRSSLQKRSSQGFDVCVPRYADTFTTECFERVPAFWRSWFAVAAAAVRIC
jgi:hypothetical protein